jgi:polyisoprenoid-binding protein YceI
LGLRIVSAARTAASPRARPDDGEHSRRPAGVIPAGKWSVDPQRSKVAFKLRHLMVMPVNGRFADFAGTVTVADDGRATAAGSVRAATLHTGDEIRDRRLRGAEFFDTDASAEIRFASTRVEPLDARTLLIAGELTIKEATREIGLRARRKRATRERVELEVSGELSRRDFGIESPQLLDAGISDKVELALSISLVKVD